MIDWNEIKRLRAEYDSLTEELKEKEAVSVAANEDQLSARKQLRKVESQIMTALFPGDCRK